MNSTGIKLNNTLMMLIIAAIGMMVILGFYQIFLKPPESLPATSITPVNEYYGEDVLEFVNGSAN
jgi:hypothetical protein